METPTMKRGLALIIVIGVTVAFVVRLTQRQSGFGWKLKRWLNGLWDAISTMLGI